MAILAELRHLLCAEYVTSNSHFVEKWVGAGFAVNLRGAVILSAKPAPQQRSPHLKRAGLNNIPGGASPTTTKPAPTA